MSNRNQPDPATDTCPGCGSYNVPLAQVFTRPHSPAYHLLTVKPPPHTVRAERAESVVAHDAPEGV